MVCGQIHAPATLPNYVHTRLMNKALRRQPAILRRNMVCLFRYAMQQGLSLPNHDTLAVWVMYMARRFPAKTNRVTV